MSAGAKPSPANIDAEVKQLAPPKPEAFFQISTESIRPSPLNPRKEFRKEALGELAASISTQGVLEPLLVRPRHDAAATDQPFEIVMGERRWRAAQLAGTERVPCLVRRMSDLEVLEAQIAENLQREDMTPLEEASAYQALFKAAGDAGTKLAVADLAARIGKSPRSVYDKLELLKLAEPAKKELQARRISSGHGAELAREKPELQIAALRVIREDGLSVMQLRKWLAEAKRPASRTSAKTRTMPTEAQKAAYLRASRARRKASATAIIKWSRAAIETELRDSLRERFGRDLKLARISRRRELGQWLAVIIQAPVQTSAKARRRTR